MTYAHFACMGGIVADASNIHDYASVVTGTPDGVRFLAYNNCLPNISDKAIQDKSKADYLAKGLVCVQVLWMVAQMIERKVTGYPLTLLEIHTMVHVLCALVIYALWLQKPKDVMDPVLLPRDPYESLLAWMFLYTSCRSMNSSYVETDASKLAWYGNLTYGYRDIPMMESDFHVPWKRDRSTEITLQVVELGLDAMVPPHIQTYFKGRKVGSDDPKSYSAFPFLGGDVDHVVGSRSGYWVPLWDPVMSQYKKISVGPRPGTRMWVRAMSVSLADSYQSWGGITSKIRFGVRSG
jgi:hypothetical protein